MNLFYIIKILISNCLFVMPKWFTFIIKSCVLIKWFTISANSDNKMATPLFFYQVTIYNKQ